jgi:hypothetical protein
MAYTLLFFQMQLTDTVSVCYDAFIYFDTMTYVCTSCDSLVFNGIEWVPLNFTNPTSINELVIKKINDNKIYDLLGRELTTVPVGTMYIRNRKLYLIK